MLILRVNSIRDCSPCGDWESSENIVPKPASIFRNVARPSPNRAVLTATRTFKAGFVGHSCRQSAGIRSGSSSVHDKNASVLHKFRSRSKGKEYWFENDDDATGFVKGSLGTSWRKRRMAIFSTHVLAGPANISPVYNDKSTLSGWTISVVKAEGGRRRGQRALGSWRLGKTRAPPIVSD